MQPICILPLHDTFHLVNSPNTSTCLTGETNAATCKKTRILVLLHTLAEKCMLRTMTEHLVLTA